MTYLTGSKTYMAKTTRSSFEVGAWTVEPARCIIISDDQQIALQPRWMDVLVLLAKNAGEVVSTDQIMDEVWGTVEVSQDSVYFTVSHLRKALAEDDSVPTFIETIAKRGYRLVAPVTFPKLSRRSVDASACSVRRLRLLPSSSWFSPIAGIRAYPSTRFQTRLP